MPEDCEMKASRERYWSEIDDQEKIKRLREKVKTLESRVDMLTEKIAFFRNHRHDGDCICVPYEDGISYRRKNIFHLDTNIDDVYF